MNFSLARYPASEGPPTFQVPTSGAAEAGAGLLRVNAPGAWWEATKTMAPVAAPAATTPTAAAIASHRLTLPPTAD